MARAPDDVAFCVVTGPAVDDASAANPSGGRIFSVMAVVSPSVRATAARAPFGESSTNAGAGEYPRFVRTRESPVTSSDAHSEEKRKWDNTEG